MHDSRYADDEFEIKVVVDEDGELVEKYFAQTVTVTNVDNVKLIESLPDLLRRAADQLDEACGMEDGIQISSIFGMRILRKA